ncbi:MAG TPA: protein kinase [Pyrinomonadaceae bacterium]|nr:protein kinase [Pyrinomonadaceae bacterium]
MTFESGAKIDKYEIQNLLGVGGMGEVYRALDTELHRPVAIKFLSNEFNLDSERLSRFIQEARSASALNHPHILTVHEIGRLGEEESSARYFVTEFIDGITLRSYMNSSKLKLGDILDIAIQISSALVAAHAAGIVHRDIKPENIMIRRDGYIKVLDFGLAKPTEHAPSVDSEAATQMFVKTNPGTVMGTVNYMSPEQASGKEVDARTDIWSLGVLLYEMLTGHLPFEGKTSSHVVVAILEKEPPPLSAYVPEIPDALEWIISEVLTKDREERTQSARELMSKLKRLKQRIDVEAELDRSFEPSQRRTTDSGRDLFSQFPQLTLATGLQTDHRIKIPTEEKNISSAEYIVNQIKQNKKGVFLALALLIFAVGGFGFAAYKFTNNNPAVASEPSLPMKITRLTSNGKSFNPVISPDGKYVAYVFQDGGRQSLLLRQAATTSFRELVPPTDGYFAGTTFSPDGNNIYYVKLEKNSNVGSLYQMSVLGGDSRKLVHDIDSPVTFSPDGKKFAFMRNYLKEMESVIFTANADGTGEERVAVRKPPLKLTNPAWSPDGKVIAFTVSGQDENGYFIHVDEVRLEDKTERKISSERWRSFGKMQWLPDGRGLVTVARDRASAPGTPMQIWRISYPGGEARRVTNDLNDYATVSLAEESRTLISEVRNVTSNIWVAPEADANRAQQVTPGNLAGSDGLSWTPDGRLVYPSLEGESFDLWIMNADGSNRKQLTFDSAADLYPSVTPDGRHIIYESNRGVGWGIWKMNLDGGNPVELFSNIGRSFPRISPDSRWIVYTTQQSGDPMLWKAPIEGGTPAQITRKLTWGHAISPDGKWIAYYTRAPELDAPLKIEIISFEGGEPAKVFDAPAGYGALRWSPDSRALNYTQTTEGISNIWSMPLEEGKPKQITNWKSDRVFWFEWSPDGRRLAASRGNSTNDLVLIENFR